MITYQTAGKNFDEVFSELVKLSKKLDMQVWGEFEGKKIRVNPTDKEKDLLSAYEQAAKDHNNLVSL